MKDARRFATKNGTGIQNLLIFLYFNIILIISLKFKTFGPARLYILDLWFIVFMMNSAKSPTYKGWNKVPWEKLRIGRK